ncbi:MAG: hypothetical protein V4690_01355 [Patescibacteria group bacterium]
MKVTDIKKDVLAAFVGGTLRVYYFMTGTEWLGKVSKVEVMSVPTLRSNEPFVHITLSANMLEREGPPFLQGEAGLKKRKCSSWREVNWLVFSFNDGSGTLSVDSAGAHKSIQSLSGTRKIVLLSANHPNG